MPFTDVGKEFIALRIGSSLPNLYVSCIAVGQGSGTAVAGDTVLLDETVRNMITGSPNFSTAKKIVFQGDFSSVQMSGTALSEFGLFQSGVLGVGSTWQREAFGSAVFDGTNELQVTSTLDVQ